MMRSISLLFFLLAFNVLGAQPVAKRAAYEERAELVDRPLRMAAAITVHRQNGDIRGMDSTFRKLVAVLKSHDAHKAVMSAFSWYLLMNEGSADQPLVSAQGRQMVADAVECNEDDCLARSHIILTGLFLAAGCSNCLDSAMQSSALANDEAVRAKDKELIYEAGIVRANVLERSKKKLDAFKAIQYVRFEAEKEGNTAILLRTYDFLAKFYEGIGAADSALTMRRQQLLIAEVAGIAQSELIPIKLELAHALLLSGNEDAGVSSLNEILAYAARTKQADIRNDALAYFRQHYLEKENYTAVSNLYRKSYPHLADEYKASDTGLWYRLMAYYSVADNRPDSAIWYYEQAARIALRDGSTNYRKSYLLYQYGRYLEQQGRTDSALAKMKLAYDYCDSAAYLPFQIKVTQSLAQLYAKKGLYEQAFRMQSLNRTFTEEEARSISEGERLRQELLYASRVQKDEAERAEKQARERRLVQYTLIAFGIGFILVVANNYRIKAKNAKLVYEAELRTIEAEVQETTLSHVGAELHDNIGQLLAVVHFQLEKGKLRLPENESILNPASQTLQQVIEQVRLLSHSLSGDFVGETGLQPSIASEIQRLRGITNLNISYETDDIEPQLSKDTRTVVFRMFQEIISNCLKHAKANNVEVKFLGDDFLLQIKDDGKGFDKNIVLVERKGFGLKNIIRRAALASLVCDIQSAPEQGTIFTIRQERAKKLR